MDDFLSIYRSSARTLGRRSVFNFGKDDRACSKLSLRPDRFILHFFQWEVSFAWGKLSNANILWKIRWHMVVFRDTEHRSWQCSDVFSTPCNSVDYLGLQIDFTDWNRCCAKAYRPHEPFSKPVCCCVALSLGTDVAGRPTLSAHRHGVDSISCCLLPQDG